MDTPINRFLDEHNLLQYRESFLNFDFATFLNLNIETISELIPSASDGAKLHKALINVRNGSESNNLGSVCVFTEKLTEHEVYELDLSSIAHGNVLPEFLELIPVEKPKSNVLLQPEQQSSLAITKLPKIEKAESVSVTIKEEPEDVEIIEMNNNGSVLRELLEVKLNNNVLLQPEVQPSLIIAKLPQIEKAESINVAIEQEPEVIEIISDSDTDSSNDIQELSDGTTESDIERRKEKYILKRMINKMDLKEINDLDMNILFSIYNKTNSFNDRQRTLLSEIIIKEVLLNDTAFLITKVDFHRLAKVIVKTFPQESITPYFKQTKYFNRVNYSSTTLDRGSLYTAYKKYQTILASAGFSIAKEPKEPAKRRVFTRRKCPRINVQSDESWIHESKSITELENEFIESRSERLRMKAIDQSRGKFTTIKYVEMYKILEFNTGYELIMKDAEFLFPRLKSYVSNFGKIAHNIVEYAKEHVRIKVDDYVYNLLRYAKNDISEDKEKFMAILLLPYVLPLSAKNTSHLAAAVQFVHLFRSESEETRIYRELYAEDPKFIKGLIDVNLKIFGDFSTIYRMIVRVGITDYQFQNPLQAIEVYFKMILGMEIAYPNQAHHLFHFLGSIAFGIERSDLYSNEVQECLLPYYDLFNKN